jgi:hypothetical protein
LINAPHDKEFIFQDGTRARNLLELVSKIEHINDHEFRHFVNYHHNDFANWIEHVLLDKHFAGTLHMTDSRNETIQLIKEKIDEIALKESASSASLVHSRHDADKTVSSAANAVHDAGHGIIHGVSLGDSIIKIPKLEGISVHKHDAEENIRQNILQKQSHPEDATLEHKKNAGHGKHDNHKDDTLEDPSLSEISSPELSGKEKYHEKSEELKAGKKWFRLFSKKDISEGKLERIESEEEDKLKPERELHDELEEDARENTLWMILYVVLVLLIITLLVYKLFL